MKIVYVTGVGNNERCIFDILGDGYEPFLVVGTTGGRYTVVHRGKDGSLQERAFVLPRVSEIASVWREGKRLFERLDESVGRDVDVLIVDAPFLARWALELKKRYGYKKIIYMCSDLFPWTDRSIPLHRRLFRRFVYRPMDIHCARRADMTWNVSHRIIDERARYAPDLAGSDRILKFQMSFRRPAESVQSAQKRILYVGYPRADHCLELLMDVMSDLIASEGVDLHLDVVGDTPYVSQLRDYAERVNLQERIVFHRTMTDSSQLDAVAAGCCMGYALYSSQGKQNYSYFGFPTKIINYFAMGLPVVMSDLAEFSAVVRERGLGFNIPVDKGSLRDAVKALADDPGTYSSAINSFVADQNDKAAVFWRSSIDRLIEGD